VRDKFSAPGIDELDELRGARAWTRNVAAAVLLAVGVGVSAFAARHLEGQADLPRRPGIFYAAFATTLLLSYIAGRLAVFPSPAPAAIEPLGRLGPSARGLSLALAGFGVVLFVKAWQMRPPDSSVKTLALWACSLVAGAAVCAVAGIRPTARKERRRIPLPWLLLIPVLLAAAAARFAGLDRVPPTFAGDEAGQVLDGLDLLHGAALSDPFGTGWVSTMRLGMLPAGWGATFEDGLIAGPRHPYAAAGVLSVAACAAAAGVLAGGWGALSCAALLAFSPHHVHFSRLASVMILDSFFASFTLLFLVAARRRGRPLAGYLAGLFAGLSLYGYFEGRALVLIFLMALPVLVLRSPGSRGERGWLALAALAGFALAAAPNLRFAAQHFVDWNARFNQVGIFSPDWWNASVGIFGSPSKVLQNQFLRGTLGLLCMYTDWPWYTAHPVLAPALLPALAIAGLGWMVGRRQLFPAAFTALVVLANIAGNVLSQGAPAPQRLSSLIPMLAILGGITVAGFLGTLPVRRAGRLPLSGIVGILLVGAFLGWTSRPPGVWDPSPGFGGASAALVTSAYQVLGSPRYRGTSMFLHGAPDLESSLFIIRYLLPQLHYTDVAVEGGDLPPGFHLFSPGHLADAREWKKRLHLRFGVVFGDRGEPLHDVGCLLFVPAPAAARARP